MKALEVLLGYGCNEKCLFCSQHVSWRRLPGLPFDLVARQLYLAAGDGYKSVCFTGGEPTIRPDLPKMIALARKLGFEYVRVQTNGVKLADAAYAKTLVDAGATFFRVSVHGHTPELHDTLVLLPGALEKVRRGVENLRGKAGVGINIVLNAGNVAQLAPMCGAFLDWGWGNIVMIYPLYEGDMTVHEAEMKLSMAEAAPHVRAAFKVFEARKAPLPRLLNFTPCAAPELSASMLSWSAHSALVVDAQGKPVDLYMAAHDDRRQEGPCAACSLQKSCLGFKTSYLARFGAAGLAPVKAAAQRKPAKGERILSTGEDLLGEGRVEIARAIQPMPEPPAGEKGELWVESMKLHLDPKSLKLDEERAQWAVAA